MWGFSLPQTRPEEYVVRLPRLLRVDNYSRWSESLAAASAPVWEDARTMYNACGWVRTLHSRFLEAEVDCLRGELSVHELLNDLINTRSLWHQLLLVSLAHRSLAISREPDSLAACKRASLDRWRRIGASLWVLYVLLFGYRIP